MIYSMRAALLLALRFPLALFRRKGTISEVTFAIMPL